MRWLLLVFLCHVVGCCSTRHTVRVEVEHTESEHGKIVFVLVVREPR